MKKVILFLTVSLFFIADIQAQQQVLTIGKGTNLSQVDGKGDDAQWQNVPQIPITRNFGEENPSVTAWFKMFYTDDFLYVYVDVTDEVHVPVWVGKADNEKVKDVHHFYDKVEIYLDVNEVLKDGNGPAWIGNEGGGGSIAPGHYQFAPWFEEDGYDSPFLMSGDLYGSMSNQAMACYSLKDGYTGYGVEFELPLDKFKNDKDAFLGLDAFKNLPEGLGFDVTVVDNDGDGNGRQRVVWCSNEQEAYYNMDGCGVVHFSDGLGIEEINSKRNGVKENYYNLAGQQVNKLRKGLFICNGRKVIR